jgi:hypothetical protein
MKEDSLIMDNSQCCTVHLSREKFWIQHLDGKGRQYLVIRFPGQFFFFIYQFTYTTENSLITNIAVISTIDFYRISSDYPWSRRKYNLLFVIYMQEAHRHLKKLVLYLLNLRMFFCRGLDHNTSRSTRLKAIAFDTENILRKTATKP